MPRLLLLSMIAIWGGSYAVVKVTLGDGVPPFVVIAVRFAIAAALVQAMLAATARTGDLTATAKPGLLTGCALLLGYSLQTVGIEQTTASMAGFLSGLIVPLVAIGGRFVFGERLRPAAVLGIGLGFAGLTLLCWSGDGRDGETTLLGILLQVGSSISYAAHILMISRLAPPGRELAFCQWQLLLTAICACGIVPLAGGVGDFAGYGGSLRVWAMLLYLGVLASGVAIAVQSRVQPKIPPSQVALLFATQPAFAAVAGAVFLDEQPTPIQWVGGALIVLGLVVGSRGRARASRPRAADLTAARAP